jgi:hypothetical protein
MFCGTSGFLGTLVGKNWYRLIVCFNVKAKAFLQVVTAVGTTKELPWRSVGHNYVVRI